MAHNKDDVIKSVQNFEIILRKFIEKSLSDAYNVDWTKGIPNNPTKDRGGMLDRWKRKKELDSIKGIETSDNLIDQAEFSDYKQIIEDKQNWKKIYSGVFNEINKRKVLHNIEELADFRNKVFHSKGQIEVEEFTYYNHHIVWIERKIQKKYQLFPDKYIIDRNVRIINEAPNNFQNILNIKIEEYVDLIKVDEYSIDAVDKYDELLLLIKKEIDAWDKKNICFGIRELFLNLYPYFDKLNFTYEGLKELFVYAHNMRKRFAIDIIRELMEILVDAIWKEEEENKVLADGCSILLLDISIGFVEKDFDITEFCFLNIDDMAEEFPSQRYLSMMILMGAKITQSKNKTKRIKNFIDQIIRSLEYDDMEPWESNYFSYLSDSYKYIYERNTGTI